MAKQQELIDQYHLGEMSPEQMVDFEKQLASNPELKAENDFQSDIINGLKDFRKAELKSRLNAIDVSPSWMEFAQQSTLVKSFGGVALATLIGSGVYLFADKQEVMIDAPQKAIAELNVQQLEEAISQSEIDLIAKTDNSVDQKAVDSKVVESKKEEVAIVEENISKSILKAVITDKESVSKEEKPKAIVPDFSAPSANLVEEESKFESSNLDELPQVAAASQKEIDVTTENIKSVEVRYKYYDGKLFLSGDFDRAPYEILEINSASGRRIYIQYLDKYYQVKTTDKLSDLPEVTDQKLIKELKLLKENK